MVFDDLNVGVPSFTVEDERAEVRPALESLAGRVFRPGDSTLTASSLSGR
jgi:hypothetical protein